MFTRPETNIILANRPGSADALRRERKAISGGSSRAGSDERPHILYLIDRYFGTHGGAERALVRIIRNLPADKFRCSMATFDLSPSLDIAALFPCPVHTFPLRRTYDWNALKMALRLRHLIRSERVSIVHTFFETSDLWGGAVAKLSGRPLLVSSRRDMGILRAWKHGFAYRLMSHFVDLVLPVCNEVRSFCIQRDGLDPKKVVTLYNGVEWQGIAAASNVGGWRVSFGLEEASHIVATVANIRRVKGIDVFIRAAAKVCREFPRAVFLVIGHFTEPAYYQELQKLACQLGVAENVKFLGGNDEVISLLKLADVFCLLSRSEGFSNALLEAMACGKPCVATHVGGNAEAVEEGRSGFLIKSQDWQTAAERILTLLREPDRALQMGTAGREIVQSRFTVEVVMQKLVRLYENLLAGRPI